MAVRREQPDAGPGHPTGTSPCIGFNESSKCPATSAWVKGWSGTAGGFPKRRGSPPCCTEVPASCRPPQASWTGDQRGSGVNEGGNQDGLRTRRSRDRPVGGGPLERQPGRIGARAVAVPDVPQRDAPEES